MPSKVYLGLVKKPVTFFLIFFAFRERKPEKITLKPQQQKRTKNAKNKKIKPWIKKKPWTLSPNPGRASLAKWEIPKSAQPRD